MAEVQVVILGLGRIGTSIGLALKKYNGRTGAKHQFRITGYSTRSDEVKVAQKSGAVDTISAQPNDAARGKDVVVMAMPYAEVEAAYQYVASDLRPGAVVLDFSPLKQNPLKWAQKHLSRDAHMVGLTPLVNPTLLFEGVNTVEHASADLFDNGVMLVMPSVTCIPEAIELATDFGGILGARTQFIDPAEHDSLIAATEVMPALLGLGYYVALSRATGWNDVARTSNPNFGMLTHALFDTHPDDLVAQLRDSKTDSVRVLDTVLAALRELRMALAADDRDTLETVSAEASENYEQWYNKRYHWKFDSDKLPTPEAPGIMTSLFGSFLGNRLNRGGKSDNDKK
ncbi:MAG: prephenate dehydrogenase [Chloroflexi bacterium]|nr:prephenate dehydrogenase [Chloroflexota bacterium]